MEKQVVIVVGDLASVKDKTENIGVKEAELDDKMTIFEEKKKGFKENEKVAECKE